MVSQCELMRDACSKRRRKYNWSHEKTNKIIIMDKNIKIAVAGTGYVGLSIATLLAQHHQVTAVDVIPEKVELINRRKSPIQDEYIRSILLKKN